MDTPPSTPWGYIQVAARSLQHAANQTFQFGRRTLFLSPTSDADDDASAQHDASPVRHEPEEVEYDSDGDAAFLLRGSAARKPAITVSLLGYYLNDASDSTCYHQGTSNCFAILS